MSSRFIHVIAFVRISILLEAEWHSILCTLHTCLSNPPLMGTWISSTCWLIVTNAAVSTGVKMSVSGPTFSYLEIYIQKRLVFGSYGNCFILKNYHSVFQKQLHHFTFPAERLKDSSFSTSSPIFVLFLFLMIAVLMGCEVVSHSGVHLYPAILKVCLSRWENEPYFIKYFISLICKL